MRSVHRYSTAVCCLLTFVSACAVNPVSGRRQVVLSTTEQETALGSSEAKRVTDTMGLLTNPQLVDYLATLGRQLLRQFPSADFPYTFQIVDLPEPNAFALPGGYIYVSRGLLVLVNSEDELVNVIGHEIGHVAARHASRRLTVAAPFAIATGITSFATSLVSPALGNVVAGIGGLTSGLVVAPYSREQEREADRLGMELAARAGWNPVALSRILHTMEREEQLRGGSTARFSFFASHPTTPERVRNTADEAARLGIGVHDPVAFNRAGVLRRLDGLLVGDDPAAGVFVENRFLQPNLDFTVAFPRGWKTENNRASVAAVAPAGDAASVVRQVGQRGELSTVVKKAATSLGLDPAHDVTWTSIGGSRAALLTTPGRSEDGEQVQLYLAWIGHRSGVLEILGACAHDQVLTYESELLAVANSFRPLAEADRQSIQVKRLRLHTARHRDTIAAIAERSDSVWSAEEMAIINGVEVDTMLTEGFAVKVAIAEPYRPGTR